MYIFDELIHSKLIFRLYFVINYKIVKVFHLILHYIMILEDKKFNIE